MDSMAWFRESLAAHQPDGVWSAEADCAVRACMDLYARTGDAGAKRYVLDWADRLLERDDCSPECAKTLFFAMNETGDPRCREAVERVMAKLGRTPAEAAPDAQGVYAELSFRMAYEMKLGGMEKAGLVAAAFRRAHQAHWNAASGLFGASLRETALYLLALTDAIAVCSMQLYEHWRALVDLYRVALRGALGAAETDTETGLMIVRALLNGVKLGLIDPERYLPIAGKRLAALAAAGQEQAAAMLKTEMEGGAF